MPSVNARSGSGERASWLLQGRQKEKLTVGKQPGLELGALLILGEGQGTGRRARTRGERPDKTANTGRRVDVLTEVREQ